MSGLRKRPHTSESKCAPRIMDFGLDANVLALADEMRQPTTTFQREPRTFASLVPELSRKHSRSTYEDSARPIIH